MKRSRSWTMWWGLGVGAPIFLGAACAGGGAGAAQQEMAGLLAAIGAPLPGLSAAELKQFNDGLASFTKPEEPADGLGPVFNGTSCGECHAAGAPGGAAP